MIIAYFIFFSILFTMNRTIFSFSITFLAGIATILGIIPCYLKEKYKDLTIAFSLAFSSGVMLTISLPKMKISVVYLEKYLRLCL